MIKMDLNKFEAEGDIRIVTAEIGSLFRCLNTFFDQQGEWKEQIGETCVCNESAYKQMQILMVRLDRAHDRALKTKQEWNLDF